MNSVTYNQIYNEHNSEPKKVLEDGKYISNHIFHKDGDREREIEIKNGSVVCGSHTFGQAHFFEVNKVIKKIN